MCKHSANYVDCTTASQFHTVPQCPHNNPEHHRLHSSDPHACFPGSCLRKPRVSCHGEMHSPTRRTGMGWEQMAQGIGLKAQACCKQTRSWCNRGLCKYSVCILSLSIYINIYYTYMPSRGLNDQSWPEIVHGCMMMQPYANQYSIHFSRLAVFLQCQTSRHHYAQRSLDGLGGSRTTQQQKNTYIPVTYTYPVTSIFMVYFHVRICAI